MKDKTYNITLAEREARESSRPRKSAAGPQCSPATTSKNQKSTVWHSEAAPSNRTSASVNRSSRPSSPRAQQTSSYVFTPKSTTGSRRSSKPMELTSPNISKKQIRHRKSSSSECFSRRRAVGVSACKIGFLAPGNRGGFQKEIRRGK